MRYYCSVCLLAKDEQDYITEWLEWHNAIGVDHFYIYDNNSVVPLRKSIPKHYQSKCTIIDFSGNHRHTQMECYAHCLKHYKNESHWMAFIDADEFIRLIDNVNINSFLQEFEPYTGIYIGWINYNANGLEKQDARPVRERFTQRMTTYPNWMAKGKSIVQMDQVTGMSAHCPLMHPNKPNMVLSDHNPMTNPWMSDFPENRIVIDHYYTKSYEEWVKKLERGSCDPYCIRKFDEFFIHNPDLAYLKNIA